MKKEKQFKAWSIFNLLVMRHKQPSPASFTEIEWEDEIFYLASVGRWQLSTNARATRKMLEIASEKK